MIPPKNFSKTDNESITVYAVFTNEFNPPVNTEPITWMLITTIPVSSFEEAIAIVNAYLKRWIEETFFKVLKSGCKTEERQLRYAENLKKTIAMDCMVALKILFMTFIGRECPNLPANVVFEDYEWKALHILSNKTTTMPNEVPSLQTVILQVAKLGGFLGRKNDGFPGPIVLFKGMQALMAAIPMFLIYNDTYG